MVFITVAWLSLFFGIVKGKYFFDSHAQQPGKPHSKFQRGMKGIE